MKFAIEKEVLLHPLQLVNGVVEKRQTMPILSNVLIENTNSKLSLTATDLEIEITATVPLYANTDDTNTEGKITVPMRKFHDTCRTLPDNAILKFEVDSDRAIIRCGRTRFTLMTLPADDFPTVNTEEATHEFFLPQSVMKNLLEKTQFAMALQDVRFYLNGLLIEVSPHQIRAVATDGHRLAMCTVAHKFAVEAPLQVIVPRKGVLELSRLLSNVDEDISLTLSRNFIRVVTSDVTFISKLVEGDYPNYNNVMPSGECDTIIADRNALKSCLVRTSILSNEKYKGIRIEVENETLRAVANNPEHEEAEDEVAVEFSGERTTVGFNVNYLVDAISALTSDNIKINISKTNSCALITDEKDDSALYVVMPMRL